MTGPSSRLGLSASVYANQSTLFIIPIPIIFCTDTHKNWYCCHLNCKLINWWNSVRGALMTSHTFIFVKHSTLLYHRIATAHRSVINVPMMIPHMECNLFYNAISLQTTEKKWQSIFCFVFPCIFILFCFFFSPFHRKQFVIVSMLAINQIISFGNNSMVQWFMGAHQLSSISQWQCSVFDSKGSVTKLVSVGDSYQYFQKETTKNEKQKPK